MFARQGLAILGLLAGAAFGGEILATVVPCAGLPGHKPLDPITVTKQHQAVPTCKAVHGSLSWGSYNYVSTVIPCWGGSGPASCTVTDVHQDIPVSGTKKVITHKVPVTTRIPKGRGFAKITTYSEKYETVTRGWSAPYNKLGPNAIPGYAGNELCKDCDTRENGDKNQFLQIRECVKSGGKAPSCKKHESIWKSKPASATFGKAKATVSTRFSIPSAGDYTFSFKRPAPTRTFVFHGHTVTATGRPWWAHVTRHYTGKTHAEFTATVTKTVSYWVPHPKPSGRPPWGPWHHPAKTTTTTSRAAHPTTAKPWSQWATPKATPAPTSRTTTTTKTRTADPSADYRAPNPTFEPGTYDKVRRGIY